MFPEIKNFPKRLFVEFDDNELEDFFIGNKTVEACNFDTVNKTKKKIAVFELVQ